MDKTDKAMLGAMLRHLDDYMDFQLRLYVPPPTYMRGATTLGGWMARQTAWQRDHDRLLACLHTLDYPTARMAVKRFRLGLSANWELTRHPDAYAQPMRLSAGLRAILAPEDRSELVWHCGRAEPVRGCGPTIVTAVETRRMLATAQLEIYGPDRYADAVFEAKRKGASSCICNEDEKRSWLAAWAGVYHMEAWIVVASGGVARTTVARHVDGTISSSNCYGHSALKPVLRAHVSDEAKRCGWSTAAPVIAHGDSSYGNMSGLDWPYLDAWVWNHDADDDSIRLYADVYEAGSDWSNQDGGNPLGLDRRQCYYCNRYHDADETEQVEYEDCCPTCYENFPICESCDTTVSEVVRVELIVDGRVSVRQDMCHECGERAEIC